MTAHQLLNSPWLLGENSSSKKRKSFKEQNQELENSGVLLTLKELLNVSSDWKEVNALKGQDDGNGAVHHEF